MAGLIRAHQWRVTPLGPIESWPQSLKTAIELMLHARQPAYVGWGRALVTLYNDAAIPLLGTRHPEALGKPYSEVSSEPWSDIRPVIEAVLAGEPQHVVGQRVNQPAQSPSSWYTYSWTPLRDAKGGVAGFFCVATETTLQLVDEQLRTVLENTRDAVNMLDLQSGRYVYLSPAHTALTGFSPEELHRFSAAASEERVHPDDREFLRRQIDELKSGVRTESSTEYRWKVKSGEYRWFNVSRKLVRDPSGQPIALVGVSRDITERKQADLEILSARAKLEAALASMTDAVYISDTQGKFLHVNEAFASFHKYKSIAECPRTYPEFAESFEVLLPDGRLAPPDQRPVSRALRGETAVAAEYTLKRKDTGETWVGSYSYGPIRERDGDIIGAVITARDITSQKQAEAEISSGRAKLEAALHSMSDAVFISDADGHFLHLNDAFAPYHRFKSLDECPANFADFVPLFEVSFADGRPTTFKDRPVARALAGETGVGVEYIVKRRDTGESWLGSYTFAPIRDENGKVTGSVVTARDVTQAKRFEQQLQESQTRLQTLKEELIHVGRVSELSQVSAGIAHELNQPLAAMLNYSSLAKRMIALKDNDSIASAQKAIEKAGEQASRASEIIRRMRDFVEKRETNRTQDNINAIVGEAITLGLIGAKADGIATHIELAPELPAILVDRVQIQQVLVNLLRNAVDAMANSARRELTLATHSRKGRVEVVIADTGSGIPENVVGRLFEPFVTTKPNGMGIGLAITRSIIEEHGGSITVGANPGGGTIFRFTLPTSGAKALDLPPQTVARESRP